MKTLPPTSRSVVLALLALTLFPLLRWYFGVGFIGSDDSLYWENAGKWLTHFPYVADNHWGLRHTLVIPIALARLALGDVQVALMLPTLIYAEAFLLVLAVWLWRVGGGVAGVALLLVVVDPLLVVWGSTADIDIVEVFFIFAAFALFAGAPSARPGWWRLLACGGLMGLAYISRETAAFAVAAFGVLFLAGFGMKRQYYFVIALGFAVPVLAELAFLWVKTGDPLYRLSIAYHHDSTINRWAMDNGVTVLIHPAIDPVVMLLTNHYFGLLAWLGIPLTVWLLRHGKLSAPMRRTAICLAVLGSVWTIIAAGFWGLLPLVPRYYLLPSLCASVLAGMALWQLQQQGRRRLARGLGAAIMLVGLGALSLENRNFMFGERALVTLAAANPGVIHTDDQTLRRADLLLHWAGLDGRVVDTPPKPGELDLYNRPRIEGDFRPGPGWVVVTQIAPAPTWIQRILGAILPVGRIPPSIWEKLGPRHPGVTLYRVG